MAHREIRPADAIQLLVSAAERAAIPDSERSFRIGAPGDDAARDFVDRIQLQPVVLRYGTGMLPNRIFRPDPAALKPRTPRSDRDRRFEALYSSRSSKCARAAPRAERSLTAQQPGSEAASKPPPTTAHRRTPRPRHPADRGPARPAGRAGAAASMTSATPANSRQHPPRARGWRRRWRTAAKRLVGLH